MQHQAAKLIVSSLIPLATLWSAPSALALSRTNAPAAVADPRVITYQDYQFHVVYPAAKGEIWDIYYHAPYNLYVAQKINAGGNTAGPPAVGRPFPAQYGTQQHVVYRDASGGIWDAFFDAASNAWLLQKLNLDGFGHGPAAAGDPVVAVFGDQFHVAYPTADHAIWDVFYTPAYDLWQAQKITLGGQTSGPAASDYGLTVSTFLQQIHFTYIDQKNAVWDAFFNTQGGQWKLQQLNLGGKTSAPAAYGQISAADFLQQQHFSYQSASGYVWDVFYDLPNDEWKAQQLNLGGKTGAASAYGNPLNLATSTHFEGQMERYLYSNSTGIWEIDYSAGADQWSALTLPAFAPATPYSQPGLVFVSPDFHYIVNTSVRRSKGNPSGSGCLRDFVRGDGLSFRTAITLNSFPGCH